MPARSIVSNRKMRKAREALRALPPEQREELRFNNIGPGDSYVGIWRVVNTYRRRFNDVEIALRQPGLSPAKEQDLRKEWRQLLEQILECYSTILPFEKAKLTTVKVSGMAPPMHSKVDLSHLPDEDIHALARILPKLGGATATGAQGDAAGHARGDAAPNRAEGARSDREELCQLATPADRPRAWQHRRREPR